MNYTWFEQIQFGKLLHSIKPQLLGVVLAVSFVTAVTGQQNFNGAYTTKLPMPQKDTPSINSALLFMESFEEEAPFNGLRLQFGTEHAFKVVSYPVYSGTKSGRFELRAADPMTSNGTRAEVLFDVPDSNERWYSFSAYFPSDEYEADSNNDIINQWHQSGSPATSLRVRKDRFILRTGSTTETRKEFDLGKVTKDTWHRFVFHFIHSNGSNGLVEVWLNGQKVLSHEGGNMYEGRLPRWKVGIYKDNWNGDRTTDTSKRVYYIDDIRIGNHSSSLADM